MINNIYYGSDKPNAYYYGSDAADRIYYGSDLVYQKADEYVFTTDTPNLSFSYSNVDAQVPLIESLKNGLDQPYDYSIASHTWIHVEMLYSPPDIITGLISTTAEITVDDNTQQYARVGSVSFMQRESGKTLNIIIAQAEAPVPTTLTPESLHFGSYAQTQYMYYTPFAAKVEIVNNSSWLTTSYDNGTITLTTYANLSTSTRFVNLKITIADTLYTRRITQDGRTVAVADEETLPENTAPVESDTGEELKEGE